MKEKTGKDYNIEPKTYKINLLDIINYVMDFGHTRPLFTIPIGAECVIDNDCITIIQE